MNFNQTSQKEYELLCLIDNLEKSYDPSSPQYKFKHIFYNKVNYVFYRPPDFPEDLWQKSLTKDPTMMPVLLKGNEVEQRRVLQENVAKDINESYEYLQNKINGLKIRADKIRNRLRTASDLYRKAVCGVYNKFKKTNNSCNLLDDIYKINVNIEQRDKMIVGEKRGDVMEFLLDIKSKNEILLQKIESKLYEYEKKTLIYNEFNRM